MEYAANGTRYWPVDQLRALHEAGCVARDADPGAQLRGVLGEDADVDAWWDQVETNLRLGRLRLVFVADVISRELRRIIEFLNEQMTQTEVIGVEIRQYVDASGQHQTLVPRLIGQTEAARDVKAARPARAWNQQRWFAQFEQTQSPRAVAVVRKMLDWAHERGLTVRYGTGAHRASMRFGLLEGDREISPFSVYTSGGVEIAFKRMVEVPWPPFDQRERRERLRDRLMEIPGVVVPEERLDKWPTFPVEALVPGGALQHFLETMDWVLALTRDGFHAR